LSERLISMAVAALTIALVAAGCGGDDGDSTATLTKAQFVKKGNAICAAGNKEIEAGFESFAKEHNLSKNQQPTKAELTEAAETVLTPAIAKQVHAIGALGTPSTDGKGAEEVLDAAEEALEKIEEEPVLITKSGSKSPFAKANAMAREYGLTTCGEE